MKFSAGFLSSCYWQAQYGIYYGNRGVSVYTDVKVIMQGVTANVNYRPFSGKLGGPVGMSVKALVRRYNIYMY